MKIAITGDTHSGYSPQTAGLLAEMWDAIKAHQPDVVVHVGDWGMTHLHVEEGMAQARSLLGDAPIFSVWGNHDVWQPKPFRWSWYGIVDQMEQLFDRYAIWHPGTGRDYNGVWFAGYNGWYSNPDPPTNDLKFMPLDIQNTPTHKYLFKVAASEINRLLHNLDGPMPGSALYKVCLTHFEFSGTTFGQPESWRDLLAEHFDLICVGHSHMTLIKPIRRGYVINAGGDYDNPKFQIVELVPGWK